MAFAGTMSDESLKGYDPYLGDKDGFDSLFVNPAGIAGQTEAFSFTIEGGTWGKLENYELLADNIRYMHSMAHGGFDKESAQILLPMMAKEINQATLDKILKDTKYSRNTSLDQAKNSSHWDAITNADLSQIVANMGSSDLQEEIMNQFNSVTYNLEFENRFGTLIRGFGLGIYTNLYLLYSLGAQGIQDLLYESGVIAGYGFDLGPLSLGFSGKLSLLLADDPTKPFNIQQDLRQQQILYGYAWGFDAGLIWEPIESLRFGLVLNDFVGSITKQRDMARGTIANFLDGEISQPNSGYSFALDMSLGMTWEPNTKIVRPKFSLDFYDFIGMIRSLEASENYSGLEEFYQSKASIFSRHMRIGANLQFLGFLNLGASYYMEYLTLGVGLDIAIFELFLEVKAKHDFSDVGANALLKVKF